MANNTWIGTSAPTKWSNAANWSNGIPQAGDAVIIPGGTPTALLDATTGSTTVAAISIANAARLDIDDPGATVTVTGALTLNAGAGMTVGDDAIGAPTRLAAGALNFTAGANQIAFDIHGNTTPGSLNAATVAVASQAGFGSAGVLANSAVSLTGNALLQFGGGQIETIASGASLTLNSANSYVVDAGFTSSNSALAGLATVAGVLALHNGASIITDSDVTIGDGTHAARISLDGGASFILNGAININSVQDVLTIGLPSDAAATTVTASALNFNGAGNSSLTMRGGVAGPAILNLLSAAGFGSANALSGASVDLQGQSLLEFASGQITTITFGASLSIDGTGAVIADAGATSSNSAIDLATMGGTLTLRNGAAVASSAGLIVGDGTHAASVLVASGAGLSIAGLLTNNGGSNVTIGGAADAVSTTVTAAGLSNAGTIHVNGNAAGGGVHHGDLEVNGAASNTGTIDVSAGKLHIAGALSGAGIINLSDGGVLELGSSASGGAIHFGTGVSTLKLDSSTAPADPITGFAPGDIIDVPGQLLTVSPAGIVAGLTYSGTTLTLNLQGNQQPTFHITGTFGGFAALADGSGGTKVIGLANDYTLTAGTDAVQFVSGNDTLHATQATFNFEDSLRGGSGLDTLALSGGGVFTLKPDFSGFDRMTFDDNTYSFVMHQANVVPGQTFTVDGTALSAAHTLTFNGSAGLGAVLNVTGGTGNDTINGSTATDTLTGGSGNDTMFGNGGVDTLFGGDGNDTLVGNDNIFASVHDTLNGGNGNDQLFGEPTDSVSGGLGSDTLTAVNANPWTIDLGATSIETMLAGFGDDHIDGAGQSVGVTVFASGGNDTVTGSAHDDFLWGGVGNDTLAGGTGNDLLFGDLGADSLSGGDGNDTLYGDNSDTMINGGAGTDALYWAAGANANINVGADAVEFVQTLGDNDTLNGSTATANLVLFAGAGTDTVTGGSGNDFLWGEAGNDVLVGNGGNDTIVGGTGADKLTGGAGTDNLFGGNGSNTGDGAADTFVFTASWGTDFVYGFDDGIDKLDMTASGATQFSQLTVTSSNGNADVDFGTNHIIVVGQAGHIAAGDFLF
jgi:hypothetical protein